MTFATINEMKEFCATNGINPIGNKSYKATWQNAIDGFMKVQAETIAMAVDAEESASEASESIETAILSVGSLIVAAATSEPAIEFYRGILKFAVFAVIITWMFSAAVVRTIGRLWTHRTDVAVYHWIVDWLNFQVGTTTIAHRLISLGDRGDRYWVNAPNTAISDDGVARSVRESTSKILERTGLA